MVEIRLRKKDNFTLKFDYDINADYVEDTIELVNKVPKHVERWLNSRFSRNFWNELINGIISDTLLHAGFEVIPDPYYNYRPPIFDELKPKTASDSQE
jgi:hypothetical protein